ncbi:MAG UNVERIFIED_CONTAM: hypothetical protein LVR18_06045 [Planctomycetaceae bacterium]
MARRVRHTVRPDLKIVVMSATMGPEPIAAFLDNCPIVHSEGRQYPVAVRYLPRTDRRSLPELTADGVETALRDSSGHVLAFLPGLAEIHRTGDRLEATARRQNLLLLPLYGDLPSNEQDRVLAPTQQRKVILATNVAETSITIDGVETVVDSGLARQMQFDPAAGLDRLQLIPISKASADQRAGRAGRTGPGLCLRLWDETSHRSRSAVDQPEILRVDLSAAVLRLKAWGKPMWQLFHGLMLRRPKPSSMLCDSCIFSVLCIKTQSQISAEALFDFPHLRESLACCLKPPLRPPLPEPASLQHCLPNGIHFSVPPNPAVALQNNPCIPGRCKTHAAMSSIASMPSNAGWNMDRRIQISARFTAALPTALRRQPDSSTTFSAKKHRCRHMMHLTKSFSKHSLRASLTALPNAAIPGVTEG